MSENFIGDGDKDNYGIIYGFKKHDFINLFNLELQLFLIIQMYLSRFYKLISHIYYKKNIDIMIHPIAQISVIVPSEL